MSQLGTHWEIDGVSAAYISRGSENGLYIVTFQQDLASPGQIAAINWSAPTICHLGSIEEFSLPEGYGFELEDIRYDFAAGLYRAVLRTAGQYLGDVTGYQAEVDALKETVALQDSALAEKDAAAAALTAEMEQAYQEGVESNG